MSEPRLNAYHTAFIATIFSSLTIDSLGSMAIELSFFLMGTTAMLFLVFLGNDRLKGFNKWHARGIMLVHYSIMLALFLLIFFVINPALTLLPETKLTSGVSFVIYGLIYFLTSKIVVKLCTVISDGVFLNGMPH